MINPYQEVRILCRTVIRNTQTSGELCPFCNGGTHGEKSLSIVTRSDGTSLFKCHRSSCGKAGRCHSNGNISCSEDKSDSPEFRPKPYLGESRLLNQEEKELLAAFYGLTQRDLNWFKLSIDKITGRLVIPIQGLDCIQKGKILTTMPSTVPHKGPKSVTFKVVDQPFIGWFWKENSRPERVVLVEDCISAMRVARQFYSVALVGCHLSINSLFEVLKFTDNIILALDKDATGKALEFQQKYKFIAPKMQVSILDKDLKWLTDAEILEKVSL